MHLVVGESTQQIQKQKASKKHSMGLAQKFPAPEMVGSMIIPRCSIVLEYLPTKLGHFLGF